MTDRSKLEWQNRAIQLDKENADLRAALAEFVGLIRQVGQPADMEEEAAINRAISKARAALDASPQAQELVQPIVGGKPFRCSCGANVFRRYYGGMYECNACNARYEGDASPQEGTHG